MMAVLLIPSPALTPPSPAWALVAEYNRMAATPLWPGFEPRNIPLVIYDGQNTYLFHHINPPMEFAKVEGFDGVFVFSGQHPDVRANTSIELGKIKTASVIMDPSIQIPKLAAITIHEAFHVFQDERHPDWTANEAELFVYPIQDASLLQLRRLETEALRRALSSERPEDSLCWAAAAVALRHERFGKMPASSAEYERGTEIHEGLACYLQFRVLGETPAIPPEGFPAEDIRKSGYEIGRAYAELLDRFDPDWSAKLEAGGYPKPILDEILTLALKAKSVRACVFTPVETEAAMAKAKIDVDEVGLRRAGMRADFLSQPGWKIIINNEREEPLWPNGFDPLNVVHVTETEILHTRWVKLGNATGSVEILNRASLSEAAGDHPLFSGVRKLTVTGIPAEPAALDKDGTVSLKADGVTGEFQKARVEKAAQTITVTLHK